MRWALFAIATFLFISAVTISPPVGLPPVPWPKDNPYTAKKAELGRLLFFDKRLSSDGTVSCASCHSVPFGFADPDSVSLGVRGRKGTRNAPTVINAAYLKKLFWDGRANSLEAQCLGPLSNPLEMTLDEDPHQSYQECHKRISSIPGYQKLFKEVFGEECTMENLTKAIATFERTIISSNSRYDQYIAGNKQALTAEELKGWEVFNKSRCGACHGGPLFSDGKFYNIGVGMDRANDRDLGRYMITKQEQDWGCFKAPTLRDITKTAPYMHDGSIKTLEEVIDYYDKGGTPNAHLDPLIKPLHLTPSDKKALIAFLKSLDGQGWEHISGPTEFPK